MYQDAHFGVRDNQLGFPITSFEARRPESAISVEFQHLFRSRYFNLVSGVGHFNINGHIDQTLNTVLPPPSDVIRFPRIGTDLQHTNVYAYSYINLLKHVTFTLGASGDFTDGDSPDVSGKRQFNPKFGITWEPIPGWETSVQPEIRHYLGADSGHHTARGCIQDFEENPDHGPD